MYVIGSEAPVPGGTQTAEALEVTSSRDFEATLSAFRAAFQSGGAASALEHIVAVVIQPGWSFPTTRSASTTAPRRPSCAAAPATGRTTTAGPRRSRTSERRWSGSWRTCGGWASPLPLISQYLPVQYWKIRAGALRPDPVALAVDKVVGVIDDYLAAYDSPVHGV